MGDLQDPEMEVLYITIPYKAIEIGGISPYMAPTLALYMVGTSKLGS
jgi:hypothetical protein